MTNRREFLAGTLAAGAAALPGLRVPAEDKVAEAGRLIVPKTALPITGTFLDEISHDIPHQNWGYREWDADFAHMKAIGIDMVVMIRAGHRKFITYPSKHLISRGCYRPSVDLVELFLTLADKYAMKFFFGLYDPGDHWDTLASMTSYGEVNRYVVDEVWKAYGHHKSFAGWYISSEIGRQRGDCIRVIERMGRDCKAVSGGLPTFISPWIDGKKAISAWDSKVAKDKGVSVSVHEREWTEILDGIHGAVDCCAFQDGFLDFDEQDAFFAVNKRLCEKFGMQCWMNAETFDRDMPIKFLPIKFDKLRLKLEVAARCRMDKVITFEFSHFMSPQSAYPQAGHLYDRYREYFNPTPPGGGVPKKS